MEGDLGDMIQSVLSDPEQMAKLTEVAKGLMGSSGEGSGPGNQESGTSGGGERTQESTGTQTASSGGPRFSDGETKLLSALGKAFAGSGGKSRSTELLMAMRPYMREEKQEKLDRAMKVARMAHIAGTVMQEFGGGTRGL